MKKDISLTYLDSVGSWLNESNGNIFPAFDDGKIDLNNPISLVEDEVSLDWWDSLSIEDMKKCYKYYG